MNPRRVFVIHGRNLRARDALFEFLRATGLEPLEWSEVLTQLGPSPQVEDILRRGLASARAIVVLLTGDDEARLRGPLQSVFDTDLETQFRPQARQNVLFEAGMALGLMPDRTVVIQLGTVKPFSDVIGRHILRMDDSAPKRNELAQRLRAAGCKVKTKGEIWLRTGQFADAVRFSRTKESVLQAYKEYLDKWLSIPLAPRYQAGGKPPLEIAKCLVKDWMRRHTDCIVELPEHDAKDIVSRIEERMALLDDRLPIAILVESIDNYKLAGIITPSDLHPKFDIYQAPGQVKALEIWTGNPYRLRGDQTIESAATYMNEKKTKSGLPVVDATDRLIGFLPPLGTRDLMGD
jgi:CBS domain-containing protein